MISDDLREHAIQFDWKMIKARADAYAAKRLRAKGLAHDKSAAGDVGSDAIRRLFEPGTKAWAPDAPSQASLEVYLKGQIKNIVSDLCRKQRNKVAIEAGHSLLSEGNSSEEVVHCARDELRRLEIDWTAEIKGDAEAELLVSCMVAGKLDCDEQAQFLEVPVDRVYRLREKIERALARIRPEGIDT